MYESGFSRQCTKEHLTLYPVHKILCYLCLIFDIIANDRHELFSQSNSTK